MGAAAKTNVSINLDAKTADVTFHLTDDFSGPRIYAHNVPWDTAEDQTESQIRALAIENARKLLREA